MLAIKSVRYMFLFVNLIQHPVGIVLHSSSEDHDLVYLTHFFQEFIAARSDKEISFATDLKVMNKRFIQIKDKSVSIRILNRRKIRRFYKRQCFVSTYGSTTNAIERWKRSKLFKVFNLFACFYYYISSLSYSLLFDIFYGLVYS